jgi:hypothetical protein
MPCRERWRIIPVVSLMLLASSLATGRNPFAPDEPIAVNPNNSFPTVSAPPGPPFRAASYGTNSIIEQLAHSSDGIVRLPPGDYSIPVRLY